MAKVLKVKIPNGYLIVDEAGTEDEYPGVCVFFSEDGTRLNDLIACVEYDSSSEEIRTEAYGKDFDEPAHIIRYEDGKDLM